MLRLPGNLATTFVIKFDVIKAIFWIVRRADTLTVMTTTTRIRSRISQPSSKPRISPPVLITMALFITVTVTTDIAPTETELVKTLAMSNKNWYAC